MKQINEFVYVLAVLSLAASSAVFMGCTVVGTGQGDLHKYDGIAIPAV